MAANSFDPHDAPDVIDVLNAYEEPDEYPAPVTAYPAFVSDDIPLSSPPPEPEDDHPVTWQVDYLKHRLPVGLQLSLF